MSDVISPVSDNKNRLIWLTIGNHPTTVPPPMSLLFRICAGRFAQRAMTGYPLTVPNDDSFDLSA